jgi:two-component system, OmpR family, response regulator
MVGFGPRVGAGDGLLGDRGGNFIFRHGKDDVARGVRTSLHPGVQMQSKPTKSICHALTRRRIELCGAQLRILVVDDNRDAAEAMAAYLSLENIESRIAFGGTEAVSLGCAWLPHVIAMDISMPECNGVQAALALRQNGSTRSIAIIAFTALDEAELCRHLTGQAFDGYGQKGQSPANLLALVMAFTYT